jgi:hypothetical protein
VIRSARSTFYRCRLSFTDARFPKYPPLPVLSCIGFESDPGRGRSSNPSNSDGTA